MAKDDVLKLYKSDEYSTDAEKQHRAKTFAAVEQGSLRWWVKYDFGLTMVIHRVKNIRVLLRL